MTRASDALLCALFFIAGAGLLGASAHLSILGAGGYETPHAVALIALAVGTACAGLAVHWCAKHGHTVAKWALLLVLLLVEIGGFMATAERVIFAREMQQSPLRSAIAKHDAAVAELNAALAARPEAVDRALLMAAEKRQAEAAAALADCATSRHCGAGGQKLVQAAADTAEADLVKARAAYARQVEAAAKQLETRIHTARTALAAAPRPSSATPVADRTGVQQWVIDLGIAGITALGMNVLGAILVSVASLVATGSHDHGTTFTITPAAAPVASNVSKLPSIPRSEHGRRFFSECLSARPRASLPVDALEKSYRTWCRSLGVQPLPDHEIGAQLTAEFEARGIRGQIDPDGRPKLLGLTLAA